MFTVEPLKESDLADMYAEVQHSRAQLGILEHLLDYSAEQFIQHYRTMMAEPRLTIFAVRVDGAFAGVVELLTESDYYGLGGWLGTRYRGQGYPVWALRDVLDRLDHRPVITRSPRPDELTGAVLARDLEKLGFQRVKTDAVNSYYRLTRT